MMAELNGSKIPNREMGISSLLNIWAIIADPFANPIAISQAIVLSFLEVENISVGETLPVQIFQDQMKMWEWWFSG